MIAISRSGSPSSIRNGSSSPKTSTCSKSTSCVVYSTNVSRLPTRTDANDIIGGLFEAMNRKEGNSGGRYKGVAYFNGGLYANPARVESTNKELSLLNEACEFDWSEDRPRQILGTLFEHSLGKEQRHAQGAHFTTAIDIMKIVGPTIVEPWRNAIEATKTLAEMQALVHRMQTFTVLDPACGSGNFLFIAYRELKRLEAILYARMAEKFPKSVDPNQRPLGFVTAQQISTEWTSIRSQSKLPRSQ